LLLYLALDDSDDRPLIIDQPEEDLDPKSIFDELVELFIAAKNVRQVIMVTHNANLVVNTDTDQVIVAFSGTHTPGKLPPIRYLSGGSKTRRCVSMSATSSKVATAPLKSAHGDFASVSIDEDRRRDGK